MAELSDFNDFNQKVIDEFRSNGGKVGGPFQGGPLLLLHSIGAKTGARRINPMMYQALDGGRMAVFAALRGAPNNPAWYHNLIAHPRAQVEVGKETFDVTASVAQGNEHEQIWTRQKAAYPSFAEYEGNTTRQIPVVILER